MSKVIAASQQSGAEIAPIEIDLWSDVVCPWCWIGKRRLDAAAAQLGMEHAIQVRFHAFELGDRTSVPGPLLQHLAQKFGARDPEQAAQMVAPVVEQGSELGLRMDFEHAIAAPTFAAHRVIQAATEQGLGAQVMERLHQGHFSEGRNIADPETLRLLAAEAGFDAEGVDQALLDDRYAAAVNADEEQARRYGVRGVPFFVLDGRYAVEGAQPTEVFVRALTMLRDEQAAGTS